MEEEKGKVVESGIDVSQDISALHIPILLEVKKEEPDWEAVAQGCSGLVVG